PEAVDSTFVSHDIWFSGNLAQNKVPQIVVPYDEYPLIRPYQEEIDALMLMPERNETKQKTLLHFAKAFEIYLDE
ncbi:MAG: hypothetical protein KDK48_04575, partial [Chlamydiia bacterium]|nr:hypothetical protein [Chlamydiia bacterium]